VQYLTIRIDETVRAGKITMQGRLTTWFLAAGLMGGVAPAVAQAPASPGETFQFLAPPHAELNRLYRINRATGAVIACQYQGSDTGVGATQCFAPGEGAEAGAAGEYELHVSNHRGEAGVFKVDRRSGEVSICYVLNEEKVVCTKPAK
jgi:hypothetical protein